MNKKGISFIEIIISTLIIAMLAAGMLGAFAGARYFFNHEKHRLQAFNFARTVLDKLRSDYRYTSSEMDETTNPHQSSGVGVSILGEMASFANLEFTYAVSPEPWSGSYKPVTVTVKWDEPRL